MTSRERFIKTLNHQQPDKVVIDIGATSQTGINACPLYKLREALGLEQKPVTIIEPAQILAKVDEDLVKAVGSDVIGLWGPQNVLGVRNDNYKPFTMPDGTPAKMPGGLKFSRDENGKYYTYPQGDDSVPPSMYMPNDGYFFDNIERAGDFDEDNLTPIEDFKDDFSVMNDETAREIEKRSYELYDGTEYGIIGMFGGGSFGDVFLLPACSQKQAPKGIRKLEDWLMAHLLYPEYIKEIYTMQSEIILKNLEIYKQAVGNRVQALWLSGTDFGTQNAPFTSVETFCELYKPFQKNVNDWIHQNTNWKTFYHTCGAIRPLIPHMIEAGVDILNPVQCSAVGMDAQQLKDDFGKDVVFWGGGIDTQKILPFGTPEEVHDQVLERLSIFSKDGGYVFASIHNIVGNIPKENLLAMINAVKEYNS